MKEILNNKDKPEYIICSAIWFMDDKEYVHQPDNITKGFVVCGRRHHNCFYVAHICLAKEYKEVKSHPIHKNCVQGFLTSKNIFLNRKEAGKLAFEQKQIPELTNCLFSEDLY